MAHSMVLKGRNSPRRQKNYWENLAKFVGHTINKGNKARDFCTIKKLNKNTYNVNWPYF